MIPSRKLQPGTFGNMGSRTPKVVPTGELGWLTPVRPAVSGGGNWIFRCRCTKTVIRIARHVQKNATEGYTPRCDECRKLPADGAVAT